MGILEKWCRGGRVGGEITAGIFKVVAPWVSTGAQAANVQYLVVFSTPRGLM